MLTYLFNLKLLISEPNFYILDVTIWQEVRHLKEKIGVLTVELEKTKADNVKLYGKIRYVQDYNTEKVISRGSKKVV